MAFTIFPKRFNFAQLIAPAIALAITVGVFFGMKLRAKQQCLECFKSDTHYEYISGNCRSRSIRQSLYGLYGDARELRMIDASYQLRLQELHRERSQIDRALVLKCLSMDVTFPPPNSR